jgi:putative addiction module component (TIGR02574 family)
VQKRIKQQAFLGSQTLPGVLQISGFVSFCARTLSVKEYGESEIGGSMSMSLEVLENELLNLSVADRTKLVDRLVASIETDKDVQAAWAAEASHRSVEIRTGAVTPVSGGEVLARLLATT